MNKFASPDGKPLNIVLVEDDDGDAMAIQRAFRKAKIANPLLRAIDGIQAIEMLKGTNGKEKLRAPYILLVDINMPRMNGIDFVKAIREDDELHQSIVFILTTSKRDEDKFAAYSLNVAGYIVKARAGEDFLNLVNLLECFWRIVELP
jgi:CheY-like chemotaxis protein